MLIKKRVLFIVTFTLQSYSMDLQISDKQQLLNKQLFQCFCYPAVTEIQKNKIKALLDEGANPNAHDQFGNYPLNLIGRWVIKEPSKDHKEVLQLLFDAHINPYQLQQNHISVPDIMSSETDVWFAIPYITYAQRYDQNINSLFTTATLLFLIKKRFEKKLGTVIPKPLIFIILNDTQNIIKLPSHKKDIPTLKKILEKRFVAHKNISSEKKWDNKTPQEAVIDNIQEILQEKPVNEQHKISLQQKIKNLEILKELYDPKKYY